MRKTTRKRRRKPCLMRWLQSLHVCWDKCITGTLGSKFSSGESVCLSNCAQWYKDIRLIIMKRFQSMH
ncbi:hypothetical protein HHK36_025226 [Tetracentron sinense]|uniref:Mitochondrial import inner membrane translocase subunit n=1 Tax=Tetracentron sinense TaxID=13715 RepID=A0A834YKQ4_TETSI|nr:hypothetical protein HHK36_025226 [Tetracentron sinense]